MPRSKTSPVACRKVGAAYLQAACLQVTCRREETATRLDDGGSNMVRTARGVVISYVHTLLRYYASLR